MGRQINFFMVGDDEVAFFDFVVENGDQLIESSGKHLFKEEIIGDYIWKQVYIKSPRSIIIKSFTGYLDTFKSTIIEYDRSVEKDNKIEKGRLYLNTFNYDDTGNKVRVEKWLK